MYGVKAKLVPYAFAVYWYGWFWSTAKGAGASEAGSQTKEGALSQRYFQTSEIVQNQTISSVPIVIDVFGVNCHGQLFSNNVAVKMSSF